MTSTPPPPGTPGRRPPAIDRVSLLIGVGYFLVSVTLAAALPPDQVWWVNHGDRPRVVAYGGVAVGAALLVLLRRWPRPVFLACGLLCFGLYVVGVPLGLPTVLLALIALFGATLWTDRRFGFVALTLSLLALGLAIVVLFLRFRYVGTLGEVLSVTSLQALLTDGVAIGLLNSSGVVILTWAVADQVRATGERRALRAESQTHAAEAAAHQQAERAARGEVEALADRQRIAREMHDIVAHGLSVMIVQADGARFAAAADPQVATNALATIAATGRTSLAEMRRLLSVLRDDTNPLPEGPQPGLADIAGLVEGLGEGGRRVHLRIEGDPPANGADGATGLTAYRIVQESLTNVLKHAGADAHAWVSVTIDPARVVVEVVDDGVGGGIGSAAGIGTEAGGAGHGLTGMAERVDSVGGTLVAGPDARGGFRVLATLPRVEPGPDATRALPVDTVALPMEGRR